MRKCHRAWALGLAGSLVCGAARAQPASPPGDAARKYKPAPLNLQQLRMGGEGMAGVGRERMKSGDCNAAIAAFEEALSRSTDPAVHRDRGLCYERLGYPYPAIDDYRFYLTYLPDAPDALDIRDRLERLEDQVSGRSSRRADDSDESSGEEPPGMEAHASISVGSHGVHTSAAALDHDSEDGALRTSLARGKGWAVGPFFAEHKWFMSSKSLGDGGYGAMFGSGQSWTESVGLELRYFTGSAGGLVIEAGYEHFNATSVDAATASALTSQVAYEFRFPLAPNHSNQLFVAPGLGYQHVAVSPTDLQTPPKNFGAFLPRVRFGFRHLLVPSVGLDLSADVGFANFFAYEKFPYDSSASITTLGALNLGVLWAL